MQTSLIKWNTFVDIFVDNLWHLLFFAWNEVRFLTQLGRVMHIYLNKRVIIDSDNDLLPVWPQAIIMTISSILSIGPLGTTFSDISKVCTDLKSAWIWLMYWKMLDFSVCLKMSYFPGAWKNIKIFYCLLCYFLPTMFIYFCIFIWLCKLIFRDSKITAPCVIHPLKLKRDSSATNY